MPDRYGIDTSILVRLATGDPPEGFERCAKALGRLAETPDVRVVACNPVVGETYVALQHHYGATKDESRDALASVLASGYVEPEGGEAVLRALATRSGCGLLDRLIAESYGRGGAITLTLDRKMAALPGARLLR